jgi:hypothetical protein
MRKLPKWEEQQRKRLKSEFSIHHNLE